MYKTKGEDMPLEGDTILIPSQRYYLNKPPLKMQVYLEGIDNVSYNLQFVEKYKDMLKYVITAVDCPPTRLEILELEWTFHYWLDDVVSVVPKSDIEIPMPECKPPKEVTEEMIDESRYLPKTFAVIIGGRSWDIQAHTVEQVANIAVFKILKTEQKREIVAMVPLTGRVFIVEKDRIIL